MYARTLSQACRSPLQSQIGGQRCQLGGAPGARPFVGVVLALALLGATPALAASGPGFGCPADAKLGPWLSCDSKGHLVAKKDTKSGAAIADYSAAGYAGGARGLPFVPATVTLKPSGGDDTKAIATALAEVGTRPANANGLRGKVLLGPGTFTVSETLVLPTSGVVLEGTASAGPNATTLRLAGKTKLLFSLGAPKPARASGRKVSLHAGVPSGTATLGQIPGHGLKANESVLITIMHNEAWVRALWGGTYPPVRNGKPQAAWGDHLISQSLKTIVATTDNSVTFSSPLTTDIPAAKYLMPGGAVMEPIDTTHFVREVGVAHLRAEGHYIGGIVDPKVQLTMASLDNLEDAWLDDIAAIDFGVTFVLVGKQARRITVQDLALQRTHVQAGGAKPFDISLLGTETLVQATRSVGDKSFYVATQSDTAGPNVAFNLHIDGSGTIEPHQRWAHGLLLDNVSVVKGGIAIVDRGTGGSGQGWGAGYCVVYNCKAGTLPPKASAGMDMPPGFTINQPPLSANWGLGLVGPRSKKHEASPLVPAGEGPLSMPSLFAQQRFDRLGSAGLATLLGPYRITDATGQRCLTVSHVADNQPAILGTCTDGAIWHVNSRGGVRLDGTELCLDAGAWHMGGSATLKACNGGASQAFSLPLRDGTAQAFKQGTSGRGRPMCLTSQSKPQLATCDGNGSDYRLTLTTIATSGH